MAIKSQVIGNQSNQNQIQLKGNYRDWDWGGGVLAKLREKFGVSIFALISNRTRTECKSLRQLLEFGLTDHHR